MTRIAIGSPERTALDRCTYCPKMCRFSCPVSHAQRSETLTPWGKMTLLSLADAGQRPLDADGAAALYGCTGCLRCQTFCEHQNDVPRALYAGRAGAVEAGVAPEAARAAIERFRTTGDAHGEDLAGPLDALRGAKGAAASGAPVYFPGCDALRDGARVARAALAVAARLGDPLLPHRGAPCCGLPLLEAGDAAGFVAHAREVARTLGGAGLVVTSSARCARALTFWYREAGVLLGAEVIHVALRWGSRLPDAAPLKGGEVAYHDPCALARAEPRAHGRAPLPAHEAPRAIVAAALGRAPAEAAQRRAEADCCGGSGLLPLTMPSAARTMARELAFALGAPARSIVTACPTCSWSLRGAGADAIELAELVARWLGE